MIYFSKLVAAFTAISLFGTVLAHPGEQHDHVAMKREISMRNYHATQYRRALDNCENTAHSQALKQRALERRAATANKLRDERGLSNKRAYHRRDLATLEAWESINHESNASYTLNTPEQTIFGANTSCVLTPETIIGPYWVKGENVRQNLTENQPGIPMRLDLQFIDIATCEPIPQLMIDIWACNATGVYSGVESGQGGLDTTFLRGVQISDTDGVVEFDTIFPGHYTGRATHEHVTSHVNSTLLPNGTYSGGTVTHIGQIFFDESLKSQIYATYPYTQNTQNYTSNDNDENGLAANASTADYDPFPEYILLGDQLSDGLLMWISIGVNLSTNYDSDASYAASWTADGGVANANDPAPPLK